VVHWRRALFYFGRILTAFPWSVMTDFCFRVQLSGSAYGSAWRVDALKLVRQAFGATAVIAAAF